MKQLSLLFALAFFACTPAFSQSTQYIPYQAVARDAAGNLVQSTSTLALTFTITDAVTGIVYQETQSTNTNNLGLFSVSIGNGTQVGTHTYTSIPWSNGNAKSLDVKIQINGGSVVDMGTTQMMSVPYALYAGSASSVVLTAGSGIAVSGDQVSETLPVTSLTTTGSGASTISGGVLNIPNYLSDLTFSNGLTSLINSGITGVTLGGALTQPTTITQATNIYTHNLTGTGDFEIEENSNPSLYVLGAHGVATDGYTGIGTSSPVSPLQIGVSGTSSLFNGALNIYQPNLAAGSSSAVYIKLGVSATSNDEADMMFNYAGAGSATNSLGIGFNGSYPVAYFYANGNVDIANLAGNGYRAVLADPSGNLTTSFGQPVVTVSTTRKTFGYTGSDQTWQVPSGVTQIYVKLWGAGGGGGNSYYGGAGPGGGGGFVSGLLAVTPGENLTIVVGQGGQTNIAANTTTYGGGGEVTASNPNPTQFPNGIVGNGGGRTAIRNGASGNSSYVDLVTAGAGGGGGGLSGSTYNSYGGGGGGGLTGANGGGGDYGYGGGQTLAASTGCGTRGTLGQGGNGCSYKWGAGGGGGYYGGAGGGYAGSNNGPGGGGSSYVTNLTAPIATTINNGTYNFTYSSTVQNAQGATWSGGSGGTTAATTAPASGGIGDYDYSSTSTAGAGGLQSSSTSTGLSGNPGYVIIYY